jgi:hypothetical protein
VAPRAAYLVACGFDLANMRCSRSQTPRSRSQIEGQAHCLNQANIAPSHLSAQPTRKIPAGPTCVRPFSDRQFAEAKRRRLDPADNLPVLRAPTLDELVALVTEIVRDAAIQVVTGGSVRPRPNARVMVA